MRIYGVTGRKDAGKTHLMTRLITAFSGRGLRIATIKHAHHDADVDHEGRDSFRHRKAGAAQVIVASPARWALMTELRGASEPGLDDLLARLDPVDLVLIEGWKAAPHPKIEVWRAAGLHGTPPAPPLACSNATVRALACDADPVLAGIDRPEIAMLRLDDTTAIADFIAAEVGL